ncbi:hypothetical protein H480_01402 [Amycolatopsis vancoresmycina DSM 44592]|uniref:Uncharacterized protein n=1 Tax=Amycolatopsis vancoresmycina DSM 44592 TaxID=1292037 RepID=R1I3E4_9PSEU|nr:hypothetical protein H480_01402 [Amycolatopsis vancoresmycina DSM 44592]
MSGRQVGDTELVPSLQDSSNLSEAQQDPLASFTLEVINALNLVNQVEHLFKQRIPFRFTEFTLGFFAMQNGRAKL